MIDNKKKLQLFLAADRIMNRGKATMSLKERLYKIIFPDNIMKYLESLRKEEYYSGSRGGYWPLRLFNKMRYQRLGIKLGFTIPVNVFGYGLVIPHYGTIVVGAGNTIGNYAVLHTSTCITAGRKSIGDAMYLSTGAKVLNDISLGDGVSISANSVVNKSVQESNVLLVGCPASIKKESQPWYIRDGKEFERRVSEVEALRQLMGL